MGNWSPPPLPPAEFQQPHFHYCIPPQGYPNCWAPPSWNKPIAPQVFPSPKYPHLNPILAADTTLLRFDIKKKPCTEILVSTYHANRHSPALATPSSYMRLISKSFPWTIDIISQDNVTCEDVWDALYAGLQEPIIDSEWGFIIREWGHRQVVEAAAKKRLAVDGGPWDQQLKRIDYLGDATIFKGLEKDDGLAEERVLPHWPVVEETWVAKLSA